MDFQAVVNKKGGSSQSEMPLTVHQMARGRLGPVAGSCISRILIWEGRAGGLVEERGFVSPAWAPPAGDEEQLQIKATNGISLGLKGKAREATNLAPSTLRTSHCLAHEVTLCAVPAEGANTGLAPAWSCGHSAGGWGGGAASFRDVACLTTGPSIPSGPRAGLDLAEQRHHVLLSVTERISARLTSHYPFCLPEPMQFFLPTRNALPGFSHFYLTKPVLVAKPKLVLPP